MRIVYDVTGNLSIRIGWALTALKAEGILFTHWQKFGLWSQWDFCQWHHMKPLPLSEKVRHVSDFAGTFVW